jgi:uncharacterized Zn ribbon protein
VKKLILIRCDGYDIETSEYTDLSSAQEKMRKEYDEFHPKENADEWEDMSYISDTNAILYANGENVYVWKIITVKM